MRFYLHFIHEKLFKKLQFEHRYADSDKKHQSAALLQIFGGFFLCRGTCWELNIETSSISYNICEATAKKSWWK